MKKIILSIFCLGLLVFVAVKPVQAQDLGNPAFSQYHYTPFLTNPAMIGASKDMQLMFNYRRKQLDAGESFDTPMLSFIHPLINKSQGRHWGGIGLSLISDNAAGFLRTNGIILGFAHNFQLGGGNFALGAQGGYFQKRIDMTGFTTEANYPGGVLNPFIENGEANNGTKGYASFSAGAYWDLDDARGQKAFLGVSYMNFTEPNVAFVEAATSKLPAALQATAGIRIVQTEKFSIMPTARYLGIANSSQANIGSWFRYHLSSNDAEKVVKEGTLGLGLWYNTANALVTSFELNQPNYLVALSFDFATSNEIKNTQNSVIELTAALKFNKGKAKKPEETKDTDGDGVTDDKDLCPETPGVKELYGCPDTDSDGIPDAYDACPTEKGAKEFGGCPDTDGDGISDKEDACPTEKGTKASNGCPDRDGDGVPDKDDQCPDKPGLASKKGCPEEAVLSQQELKILESAKYVHFETGTAIIEKTSYTILDLVVEVMKYHPDDILNLEGHTDSDGDADTNRKLGLDRANAVKAYLISKGVAADKIIAESSGEDKPIADNNTDDGKSLNRRVEMKILKK